MTDTQKIHAFAEQNLLVEKYLLGELTGADLEDFEIHVWECPVCFEAVKAGQKFAQGVASSPAKSWRQRIKEFWARHVKGGTGIDGLGILATRPSCAAAAR
jgi:hypothetical protein